MNTDAMDVRCFCHHNGDYTIRFFVLGKYYAYIRAFETSQLIPPFIWDETCFLEDLGRHFRDFRVIDAPELRRILGENGIDLKEFLRIWSESLRKS